MSQENLFEGFEGLSKVDWIKKLEQDLKGKPYSDFKFSNGAKIDVEAVYHTDEAIDLWEAPSSGSFRRSSKVENNQWVIEDRIVLAGDDKKDNATILDLLNRGLTGITLEGPPTQNTLKDILPQYISLGFEHYSDLNELTDLVSESFGDTSNDYKIYLNHDPIGSASTIGSWDGLHVIPPKVSDILESFLGLRVFSVNGQHYHNAGGNAVSELAFSLAHAHEYIVFQLENGVSIDRASSNIKVQLGIGNDYFLEIAKIRAFRILWSKMISAYNPSHDCSKNAMIHSISSQFHSTLFDAHNNMLRATTQAMAAIAGGTDLLRVLPYDTAWTDGDSFSHRIARNVQLLLQEESYFDKVIDPSGGSYYIEYLTQELAKKAWNKFQKIENKGGFIGLMTSGNLNRELKEDATEQFEKLESGETKVLGINLYPNQSENALNKLKESVDEQTQIQTDFKPIELVRLVGSLEEERLNNELKEELS